MKEVLVSELRVGDVYYYQDRYEVVLSVLDTLQRSVYVQCIMAPTTSKYHRGIGHRYYMSRYKKVTLLVRDGAKDLKVGDVFIDRDMVSRMETDQVVFIKGRGLVAVKCIVGPTTITNREYLLPFTTEVLLCSE